MPRFKYYWQRRRELTGPESIATLSDMQRFFGGDGKNWNQDTYHRGDGTKCLVGAAQSMRTSSIEDALYWVRLAIAERHPDWLRQAQRELVEHGFGAMQIEAFNDTHSFAEVTEVIERAKQLAGLSSAMPPPRAALTYQPGERVEIITVADIERVAVRRRE